MSNITKHNHFAPHLGDKQIKALQAYSGRQISQMEQNEAFASVLQIINRSYIELGQMPTGNSNHERDQALRAMIELTIIDIKEYFPRLTIDELNTAVRNGIRREYGDYFGFNVVSIHKFIRAYLDDETRRDAIFEQNNYLLEARYEVSEAEKLQLTIDGIRKQFQQYKETGILFDFGSITYTIIETSQIWPEISNLGAFREKAVSDMQKEETPLKSAVNAFLSIHARNDKRRADEFAADRMAKEYALAAYFDTVEDIEPVLKMIYNTLQNDL